jgi:hypothetical protein
MDNNSEKKNATNKSGTGWDKTLPPDIRRNLVLRAHHGNELAAALALKNLANSTRDKETMQLAATDAVFLLKMSQRYGKTLAANQEDHDSQTLEKETLFFKNPAE